jgi:general secretion pathway protein H
MTNHFHPIKSQRGFTLIEIMIVMVLLGLVVGIAVATLGGGNLNRELVNEVNRLHGVLRMASEEAIFTSTEIGFTIDNKGYEFLVYQEDQRKWVNSETSFLRAYPFEEWLTVDLQREGSERRLKYEGAQSDMGLGDMSLSGEETQKRPSLMLLSSGEVTPFRIGLQVGSDSESRIEIVGEASGEIRLPYLDELDGRE